MHHAAVMQMQDDLQTLGEHLLAQRLFEATLGRNLIYATRRKMKHRSSDAPVQQKTRVKGLLLAVA